MKRTLLMLYSFVIAIFLNAIPIIAQKSDTIKKLNSLIITQIMPRTDGGENTRIFIRDGFQPFSSFITGTPDPSLSLILINQKVLEEKKPIEFNNESDAKNCIHQFNIRGVAYSLGVIIGSVHPLTRTGEAWPAAWYGGAEHILEGSLFIGEVHLDSDPEYPLAFKLVKNIGYVYLCGRGLVTIHENGVRKDIQLGTDHNVIYWLPGLRSNDTSQRQIAAQAIGYLGSKPIDKQHAVEALIVASKDREVEVRRNVAEALGRIGDPRAIDSLIKLSDETEIDENVREIANESLELLKANALAELIKSGKEINVELITMNKYPLVRAHFARSLALSSCDASIHILIALLQDGDELVREEAAKSLSVLAPKTELQKLKNALLSEKYVYVKIALQEAIKKIE